MDAPSTKQEFYEWIGRTKSQLDSLYPLVDRMIECPTFEKNFAPQLVRDTYPLIFEDTFDGVLDPALWNTAFIWGPDLTINLEEQYYVDTLGGTGQQLANPFSFDADGNLLITAAPIVGQGPTTTQGIPGGQNYTSGIITTRDSCCFTGGYIEACVQMPCCPSGMWTAVWLLNCLYYDNAFDKNILEAGANGSDTFNPEIDFEWVDNFGCDEGVLTALHYFTGDRNNPTYSQWDLDGAGFTETLQPTGVQNSSGNLYTSCSGQQMGNLPGVFGNTSCVERQVVGIHWCPSEFLHFYLNGQLINCIDGPSNIIPDQAMYLILNFAVGGRFPFSNGTLANPNDYPASMLVEYVRIYGHPDSPGKLTV